jgi:hypothetical protein
MAPSSRLAEEWHKLFSEAPRPNAAALGLGSGAAALGPNGYAFEGWHRQCDEMFLFAGLPPGLPLSPFPRAGLERAPAGRWPGLLGESREFVMG